MKHIYRRLRGRLCNECGEIAIYSCFFVVGVVMLISFLLLYASIRINCINIRNGAKMELNNLSASIYADTYRSQRETNFSEYLSTLTPAVLTRKCWRIRCGKDCLLRYPCLQTITRLKISLLIFM